MLPDTTAHILELVTVALDEFESVPASTSVRRALRIARLRGNLEEALRFALELGMAEDESDNTRPADMASLRTRAETDFLQGRTRVVEAANLGIDDVNLFLQQPLQRLERDARPYEQDLSLRSRIQHENKRVVAGDIVAGVGNDSFLYLMRCEAALRLALTGEGIFDRHREAVDTLLMQVAPEVLDMLNAAIKRASVEDEVEARVHALTSCRRVLTAIADVVFQPRSEPYVDKSGSQRSVGPSQYRNRILAAMELSDTSTRGRALAAALDEFSGRLDRLDELTQKGVHEHPTRSDVDFGVIQTYLLAGEVLDVCTDSGTDSVDD